MVGKLVVLSGATGVGKTRIAIELCRQLHGEIIGADSVQVYRGFDIGSGKPTAAELGGVAHHMIDVIEPDEPIDAAHYATLADAAIADVHARGKLPIVVGGTGLWLRALLRGLVESPPVDAALRAELEAAWRADAGVSAHARLQRIDPLTAEVVHPNDMVRVVRALEYHAQTGRSLGEVRREHALGAPRHDALTLWLELPRTRWEADVATRIDAMLAAGWVEEVRGLLARHGREARAFGAVGYREIVEHLEQGVALDETRRRIERATRLYGKRQRTWLKGDTCVDIRCEPDDALQEPILGRIAAHCGRVST